ncbi:hypothetical protein ABKN59_006286 [Abortiporus biennis]
MPMPIPRRDTDPGPSQFGSLSSRYQHDFQREGWREPRSRPETSSGRVSVSIPQVEEHLYSATRVAQSDLQSQVYAAFNLRTNEDYPSAGPSTEIYPGDSPETSEQDERGSENPLTTRGAYPVVNVPPYYGQQQGFTPSTFSSPEVERAVCTPTSDLRSRPNETAIQRQIETISTWDAVPIRRGPPIHPLGLDELHGPSINVQQSPDRSPQSPPPQYTESETSLDVERTSPVSRRLSRPNTAEQSSRTVSKRPATSPVETEEEPRPKKVLRKTAIACDFCRGRKLKCNGITPTCQNCSRRSIACNYQSQPRRRGPGKAPKGSKKKKTQEQTGQNAGESEMPRSNMWNTAANPVVQARGLHEASFPQPGFTMYPVHHVPRPGEFGSRGLQIGRQAEGSTSGGTIGPSQRPRQEEEEGTSSEVMEEYIHPDERPAPS